MKISTIQTGMFSIGLLFVLASCNKSVRDEPATLLNDADYDILRKFIINDLPTAYGEQDTALLNHLLHEKFQLIDDQGDTYSKQDELEYASNYGPSYDFFSFEIKKLDVFDNGTSVISGVGTLRGEDDRGSYTTTYQFSNVLIKDDGAWKVINSHVSGVDEVRE